MKKVIRCSWCNKPAISMGTDLSRIPKKALPDALVDFSAITKSACKDHEYNLKLWVFGEAK